MIACCSGAAPASNGDGAPITDFSTQDSRQLGERLSRLSPPTLHGSGAEQMVAVEVAGQYFRLPEPILSESVSLLRLSTGVRVGLEDYARAVCLMLLALERRNLVSFPPIAASDSQAR